MGAPNEIKSSENKHSGVKLCTFEAYRKVQKSKQITELMFNKLLTLYNVTQFMNEDTPFLESYHMSFSLSDILMGDLVIFSKEIIGQGAFGTVFKGRWQDKPCAAKMLSILGNEVYTGVSMTQPGAVQEEALARFKRECNFMKTLLHPNVVRYYDTLFHPGSNLPMLVMELMDSSLCHYLSNLESLSKKVQLNLCHNVAAALEFLHSHNIIHRDLCADNILLKCTSDVIPVAKVTDFGMSRLIMKHPHMTHSLTAIGHRPGYLPPEAPKEYSDYDSSLDVFMFGAVMAQIACKQPTIRSKDERKLLVNQLGAAGHPLKPMISMCLDENKERRPNARMLCVSLEYACRSLATEQNGTGDQDMDRIANEMQQLCLRQQSSESSTCYDKSYIYMYLCMCAYHDTWHFIC